MSFEVRKTQDLYELILENESPHAHSFGMHPSAMEPQIARGLWLFLAFAVWSGPDRMAILQALALAKEPGLDLHVGIRPFDLHDEFATWCPLLVKEAGSPIWLLMKDGVVLKKLIGMRATEDLHDWAKKVADR